jgi:hypothetical protein
VDRNIYTYNNGFRDLAADPAVLWRKLARACKARHYGTWDGLCDAWMRMVMPPEPIPVADADGSAATIPPIQPTFDPSAWLDFQADLVAVIREAFGIAPLDMDGNGLTEDETMGVLSRFLEWREEKKTNGGEPPSSSIPTDGHPPVSLKAYSDHSTTSACTASS